MNFLKTFAGVLIGCFIVQSFLPWWTLTMAAAAAGFLFGKSGGSSFLAGFSGVALLWFGLAFWIDWQTQSSLSQKVALLLPGRALPVLYLITSFLGGLTGGGAALTGYFIRKTK